MAVAEVIVSVIIAQMEEAIIITKTTGIVTKIEKAIKEGQGRLQHTTTHQAHSLSVAAALAVQKIIHNDNFLEDVHYLGEYMRKMLVQELGNHPFFYDVRGRGLRFSLEYRCKEKNKFGNKLKIEMEKKELELQFLIMNAQLLFLVKY